jgi:hypothetical protein
MKRLFAVFALLLSVHLVKAQYPAFKTYDNIPLGNLSVKLYGNVVPGPICNRVNFTSNVMVPTAPSLLITTSSGPWSSPGASTVINGFQYLQNIGGTLLPGPVISTCSMTPGTYAYSIPGGSTFSMIVEIETSPSTFKIRITP